MTGILCAVCAPGLPVSYTLINAQGRGVAAGHGADEGYGGVVVFTLGTTAYNNCLQDLMGVAPPVGQKLSGKDLRTGRKVTALVVMRPVVAARPADVWSPA